MREPLSSLGRMVAVLALIWANPALGKDAIFAGLPVAPGATVRAHVPLSALEKKYTSEGWNGPPPYAVAVLAVPPAFDPKKSWPVLVAFSSSDKQHQNRDALEQYRDAAFAEGWVVIAGDGPKPARQDTSGWRAGTTLAALDALHRSFPGSEDWPLACAGGSGGAKQTGLMAPLLWLAGNRIIGLFLSGINEDRLSTGYRTYKPADRFLNIPIFLSIGAHDLIATRRQQIAVRYSMQRTGFHRIREEIFPFGHILLYSQIVEALRWFRELQGGR
ncbi:MAG TPA: hypothetical protein VGI85_15610 [Chthoniobacterales bacterium]